MAFGVILPGVFALLFAGLWVGGFGGRGWDSLLLLLPTAFLLVPVVFSLWRLKTGPGWYRFRGYSE